MLEQIKNKFSNKILFTMKVILYIVSVIAIIFVLKYFGFFKGCISDDSPNSPVIPGNTTIISKPSQDSGEILTNIDNMIDFLEKRKKECL